MTEICDICGKPILQDEGRYTLWEPEKFMHYSCWDEKKSPRAARKAVEQLDTKTKELIAQLKRLR